ncbi:hypothetical protein B0H19DRAFT_1080242 [Mycena capillaripes]|nr:hypothetical protein B0H19DRAFT_1080242 [Mycena capillaripes]
MTWETDSEGDSFASIMSEDRAHILPQPSAMLASSADEYSRYPPGSVQYDHEVGFLPLVAGARHKHEQHHVRTKPEFPGELRRVVPLQDATPDPENNAANKRLVHRSTTGNIFGLGIPRGRCRVANGKSKFPSGRATSPQAVIVIVQHVTCLRVWTIISSVGKSNEVNYGRYDEGDSMQVDSEAKPTSGWTAFRPFMTLMFRYLAKLAFMDPNFSQQVPPDPFILQNSLLEIPSSSYGRDAIIDSASEKEEVRFPSQLILPEADANASDIRQGVNESDYQMRQSHGTTPPKRHYSRSNQFSGLERTGVDLADAGGAATCILIPDGALELSDRLRGHLWDVQGFHGHFGFDPQNEKQRLYYGLFSPKLWMFSQLRAWLSHLFYSTPPIIQHRHSSGYDLLAQDSQDHSFFYLKKGLARRNWEMSGITPPTKSAESDLILPQSHRLAQSIYCVWFLLATHAAAMIRFSDEPTPLSILHSRRRMGVDVQTPPLSLLLAAPTGKGRDGADSVLRRRKLSHVDSLDAEVGALWAPPAFRRAHALLFHRPQSLIGFGGTEETISIRMWAVRSETGEL